MNIIPMCSMQGVEHVLLASTYMLCAQSKTEKLCVS